MEGGIYPDLRRPSQYFRFLSIAITNLLLQEKSSSV